MCYGVDRSWARRQITRNQLYLQMKLM